MKTYWTIDGPGRAPKQPCIAFDKLDGQNLRFEWSKKRGWYKFGTRRRLFDENEEEFGRAIPIFMESLAEGLEEVIKSKDFRGVTQIIAFCEFWGPQSFCGMHAEGDELRTTLIDVSIHKKGMVLPRDFVKHFGHLDTPKVVYEGNFSNEFILNVRAGKYDTGVATINEGVVAKGVNMGKKKNPQHGLWMRKAKTDDWMDELRRRAQTDESLKQILADNEKEQAHGEV